MRTTSQSLALLVIFGIASGASARADLSLSLESLSDTQLVGAGTKNAPKATISFTTNSGGVGFQITSAGSAFGLDGSITGNYSYTTVTGPSNDQMATATGTGKLKIVDANNKTLTGTVSAITIIAVTNPSGAVTYSEQIDID